MQGETMTVETMKHIEGQSQAGKVIDTLDGGKAVLVPDHMHVHELDPIDPVLTRIKEQVRFPDKLSFIKYVNAYKTRNTKIFADLDRFTVQAVFDYHSDGNGKEPDHCRHTAIYEPALSLEWARWKRACNEPFSQSKLAEFLEENLEDIQKPDASTVLEVVRNLNLTKKAEFKSIDNAHTGARELVFKETITGRGDTTFPIPEHISLGIPVFFGGFAYPVKLFVRFRLTDTKVSFALKIHRAEYVEKQAFQDLLHGKDLAAEAESGTIAAETGVPVFLGSRR